MHLEGVATLGGNVCYLNLYATLGDTDNPSVHIPANWYNVITKLVGTNDMSQSDPGCAYLSVVDGSGTVNSGPNAGEGWIDLDSLVIRIQDPNGPIDCEAGPVTALVENVGSDINAVLDQVTPCGPMSADLIGAGQIG